MIKKVAPYAGAWIEILPSLSQSAFFCVAPYAGAWIEISIAPCFSSSVIRRPLRRGVD